MTVFIGKYDDCPCVFFEIPKHVQSIFVFNLIQFDFALKKLYLSNFFEKDRLSACLNKNLVHFKWQPF